MAKSIEVNDEARDNEHAVKHITPSPVKRSWIIGAIVILVIVSGSTLLLGMAIGANFHRAGSSVANANGLPGGQYGPNGRGGFGGFRMGTTGTVTAISSSSITIQESDGTSKTYAIDSNTTIREIGNGSVSASDITTGMNVAIRSSSGASTTASSIIVFATPTGNSSTPVSGSSQSY